jgi:hypothetical protein
MTRRLLLTDFRLQLAAVAIAAFTFATVAFTVAAAHLPRPLV